MEYSSSFVAHVGLTITGSTGWQSAALASWIVGLQVRGPLPGLLSDSSKGPRHVTENIAQGHIESMISTPIRT